MADSTPPSSPGRAKVFARRAGSTVFLWGVVAAAFASRWSWAYLVLIGLLVIAATIEYFRMFRAADVACFPRFGLMLAAGYSGVLAAYFLRGLAPPQAVDALAVFVALAGAFTLQLRRPILGVEAVVAVAVTVLGFVYIAWAFGFAARLAFLFAAPDGVAGVVDPRGAMLVVWLLAVTKFADMGAYLTGSLIGRHKMIPHVSPAKTWEGFAGALVFSQLAAVGLFVAFPDALKVLGHAGHVVTLGLLLSVLAVVGDLAESVVKRALKVKDSGRMLPGIGGALDLIDSICFTAPVLYFYLTWILLPHA